jgi:hypothetical protein
MGALIPRLAPMGALSDAERQMLTEATERARARMSGRTIDSDGRDSRPEHQRITEHLWLRYDTDDILQAVWLPIGVIPERPVENLRRERTRWLLRNPGGAGLNSDYFSKSSRIDYQTG